MTAGQGGVPELTGEIKPLTFGRVSEPTRQEIVDEIERLGEGLAASFRALREQHQVSLAPLRAQCAALGHIWRAGDSFAQRFDAHCAVCGQDRPAKPALLGSIATTDEVLRATAQEAARIRESRSSLPRSDPPAGPDTSGSQP